MKYVDIGTNIFGMIPPEVKITAFDTGLENIDKKLLLALNTIIMDHLDRESPKIVAAHMVNYPKTNIYYPGIMKDDAFLWKKDGVSGLGDDRLNWGYDGVIKEYRGGGSRSKRSRSKRSSSKRDKTKRSRSKRIRSKRSRSKQNNVN